MNKLLYGFILSLLISTVTNAQTTVTWPQLAKVEWTEGYVRELKGYYSIPRFSSEVWALNGEPIKIEGFCIPLDVDSKSFALSSQPSSMCFFCSGAGPESVMEIIVQKDNHDFDKIKTDMVAELTGTLKLNKTDPDHLMYILENTKLLKIKK